MESREAWNEIAPGWSPLKQKPWPPEIYNIEDWKGKILDDGCGNGRNLYIFKDSELYGIDFSSSMIEEAKKYCKEKNIDAKLDVADATLLPFEDYFFDHVICVAVLGTIKKDEISKALQEIKRVLKSDGSAFLSVWNKGWPGNKERSKETTVPWMHGDKKIERYYYLFDEEEFIELLEKEGFKIIENYTKKDNKMITIVAGVAQPGQRCKVEGLVG